MTRTEFQDLVEEALHLLPEKIKKGLDNIAVVVEDFPSRFVLDQMGLRSPYDLLGLYQGVPLERRGFYYGNVLPDRICLYKGPIEAHCRSKSQMIRRIQEVVLHEIGHYFGFDDHELDQIMGPELEGE
jgi:predicted Zn-dependent protease with MMP-like domain